MLVRVSDPDDALNNAVVMRVAVFKLKIILRNVTDIPDMVKRLDESLDTDFVIVPEFCGNMVSVDGLLPE